MKKGPKKTGIGALLCGNKQHIAIILFFVAYMLVGLSVYKDYGISTDEEIQRRHSLVSYKYVNEKIFHREVEELRDWPELEEYEYKYYGIALQMPLVLIEDLCDFQMTTRQIFLMRHLYNFIICFLGYICFYVSLKKIFKSQWLALTGTALISLYPRFYGNQFFDIKNMIFAALNMITLYTLIKVVEKRNWRNTLLFAFAAAVTTNQRIMGFMFPVILVGYYIVSDAVYIMQTVKARNDGKEKILSFRNMWDVVKKYVLVIFSYFVLWFVITPSAWSNPVEAFLATSGKFSHWAIGTMVFGGRLITSEELPWYYLFVWFGISIPLMYLCLFILGHVYVIKSLCKSKGIIEDILGKDKWLVCLLLLFWGPVGAVIFTRAWIYIEWRHMYFVFVPFCCIAVFGVKFLLETIKYRKAVYGIVAAGMVLQISWMVYNHPYQYVYFNPVGRSVASDFDRDSWGVATCDMLRWVLENEDGVAKILSRPIDYNMFTEEEKARLYILSDGSEEMEYRFSTYRNVVGDYVEFEGYEEVHAIWVDGFKIGSVFRKSE